MSPVPSVKHSSPNTGYWIGVLLSKCINQHPKINFNAEWPDRGIHCAVAALRWTVTFTLRVGPRSLTGQQHMKRLLMLALQWEMKWQTNVKLPKQSWVPAWKVVCSVCFASLCSLVTFIHTHWILFKRGQSSSPVSLCGSVCCFRGFLWKTGFLLSPEDTFPW